MLGRLIKWAEADPRIVAAAVVGSLADRTADRWSDIDLAMGVSESASVDELLDDWSGLMAEEFSAVVLLDLMSRGATYRVFMLDDWLQVDLSFAPEAAFHKATERFKPLFGAYRTSHTPIRDPGEALGWAILWARTARASIDRGRLWSAEFCISALRDETLAMACAARGIRSGHGRGTDDLPDDVIRAHEDSLVRSLSPDELERALDNALILLAREAAELEDERLARIVRSLPSLRS